MGNFKKLSDVEIKEIANNHKIDVSIINSLLDKLEYYFNYLSDTFEEFRKLPYPKYDELPWSIDPTGWAKLSLFYHTNKKYIELQQPKIFTDAVFTPKNPIKYKTEALILKVVLANHIIKTYFEKMANENKLFDKQKAEEILEFDKRNGKRPDDEITKRNDMIKMAASYLKSNGISEYTPIIRDLFSRMNIDKLKPGTIRQIVKRS